MNQKPQYMQLDEKIDYILEGEDLALQAARAQEIAVADPTFVEFMKMASLTANKLVGLPGGLPETYRPQTDMPQGISDTTARQEIRRIRNYVAGGSMAGLPAHRRELSWMQTLEGLHWKEAVILSAIKDQTLFEKYPQLRNVLVSLNFPVDVAASEPAKKAKSGSKKTKEIPITT